MMPTLLPLDERREEALKVRQATLDDVDAVMEWGVRFHAYSIWGKRVPIVEDDWRETVTSLLGSDDAAVFMTDNGFCGGLIFPMYFNKSYRIAQELFWFASSGGSALREAFEDWAKERGAQAIQMSCIADDREAAVRRLFRKAGYDATETALMKEIA
jgi:hypothetical protein